MEMGCGALEQQVSRKDPWRSIKQFVDGKGLTVEAEMGYRP